MRRILFLLLLTFSSVFSQNTNWSSFISFPNNPSPYFTDWERNPNIGSLNINYLGTSPIEFYFEIIINIDGYGEAIRGRTDNREYLSGPMSEILTFNDISDWQSTKTNSDLERLVIQTGKLPESNYSICVSTFSTSGELLTETCTDFEILLPNPPQLLLPDEEGSIEIAQPSFMWNPVSTPSDILVYYHVKIVEILDGQTAFRAFEANVPILETEVQYENMYTYSLDDYPLEQNHNYAWQVQATNNEGVPIASNDGYSEIWQFTYGNPNSELPIDTLTLIENYAYLFDLKQLNITDNTSFINLDGSCRMLIKGTDGIDKYLDAFAQNLMLQKDSYENPVFLGGNIIGSIYEKILDKSLTGDYFKPTELEFIPPQQLSFAGEFNLGDENGIPLIGRLNFIDNELIGELTAIGDASTPMFSIGDDSFKLNISSVALSFPNLETRLEGSLSVFGTQSNCRVDEITLEKNGGFSASISCDVMQEIALLQGSNLFNINVKSINGKINGNLLSNKHDYKVVVDGGLQFNVNPDNLFGADLSFELSPNKFKLLSFNPNVDVDASTLDLGWLKWNLKNLKLNSLSYENKIWDFDLAMDVDLSFPDFGDKKLPTITGVSFTPKGFEFPEVNFSNFSIPKIDFKAFEIEMFGISAPAFIFDFSKWNPGSIAQMAFNWNVKFSMPNLPNGTDENFKFPNWNLKAKITNGNFNLILPDIDFPNAKSITIPGGLGFNVSSFSGKLNTSFDGSIMSFLPDVKIGGDISLPERLKCDGAEENIKLRSMITLNGNGSISGIIEDVVPKCPINIGLASLYMKKSKIEFKNEDGQKIYLDGEAAVSFTAKSNQKEVGKILVIYELVNSEIIKAEGEIKDNFVWDLPSENPTFSFNIAEAKIGRGKLLIDGRSTLQLSKDKAIGVTFDDFTINLDEYTIEDGQVIFDEPFAMVIDNLADDNINFKTVLSGDIPNTESYLYYTLPEKIALNKNGFTLKGNSKAQLKYQGKVLGDLSTDFSNDFAFSLKPFKVISGKCDIIFKDNKVAYFNEDGFFPDINYFLNRVIPDKIPLPTLEIAYLQIKRDDNLLVNVNAEGNSTRFSTREGEPVELVFPSMQFDLAEAPKILVNFSIAFDDGTGEVTDGFIRGVIPEESIHSFDLTRVGIPYTIYSIYYGNLDGTTKFRLAGKAKLFDTEVACQDSLILTLSQNGMLEGRVSCDIDQIISLIPDSDKLNLHLNNISGQFNADLLTRNFDFNITLDSDLRFNLGEGKSWGVWTLLEQNQNGLELVDSRMDDVAIPKIDLEQFKIGFNNFVLGRLDYNSTPDANGFTGWDFEFGMDLNLSIPSLGLEIPNIPNVTLNRTGFHTMDRISIPSFSDSLAFQFEGIELKPLAFRMPKLDFNWFNPLGGEGNNWDFNIDFEINFPNMEGASGSMRYPHLTLLDANFLNGKLIGNIDPIDFDLLDGLKLNFGDGFGFSLTRISGRLFDDNGNQGVDFNFNGHLDLPEYLRCDGEQTTLDLTETTFSLNSSGQISGIINNFVPRCPIDLGFGQFQVTSSSINFSVSDSGQVAILDMTGDLVVNTGDGNSVTANGVLQMDLLTGQIIDGSITIEEQFVWAIPNDKPVLRFTINRAVLDRNGLTINGDSDLLLPGGQTRNARFENFNFDFRKFKVNSGRVEINADFAIKIALEDGEVVWSVISANTPLTENQTAKIGFTSNLVLDADGLSTNGEAIAAIRWDEDPAHQFGNLKIRYTNDFKFSLRPFMVSEGRADLIHVQGEAENIIATLTHDGLNLGDIFGLIPVPEIIPLPDREIAYLRIKSGNRVLVQTETVDAGLRIYSTEENPTSLVLPALQIEGREVDSIPTVFDVVVNPATGQIVSGEITLARQDSASILNLRDRGIPADIFKIHYDKNDGLSADAQVDLPNILSGMPIKMRKLRFNRNGLAGTVNLGTYSEVYPRNVLPTLDFANLGSQAIITLEGLDVSFGENNSVGFSGKFIPLMFVHDRDTTKVQYAANWNNVEHKFTFSFDFADGEVFDFGIGTFTPGSIGDNPALQLTLSEEDFELLLSGEFRANQFGDDFALGIEGLKITKNNVSAEAISKSAANPISFKLFNSDFRIFDKDVNNKAIRFTYADNVLKLILSGDITLFGKADNKVTFSNFTIGTDGTFSIGQANFLNSDLVIVDNYIAINNVGISNNKLAVGGWIKLPEPVGNDTQFNFGFNLDANGTITADNRIGNKIVLINEPQRIGNPAETEYDFWKAKFDLTYLALELNFANISNSSVQMVSDIYWDNNRNKRVSLGNKSNINSIVPGLEITFAGDVNWGSASVNGNFVNFDEDMFKVKVNTVQLTSDRNNNLTFGIGGEFGLNFDAVQGGLNLADFQFNKTGIVNIGRITGGTLTIEDVGSLTLNNIGYSDSQTRIWVKGGESPGAASGSARADSTQITVNNYLSFGGEITIDGFGAAGVDRFLTYSTDNSYTLLVRNAHFEIEGTMSASMDLLYYTGDNGFMMRAGGSATIGDFSGSVVGKVAKINNKVSWGFFIQSDMRIDIVPIVITGVGGGFFYNPNADDILAVKRLANVSESNGKIAVQGGKFAIFLFGQAAIVSDVLIYGRVLITVTDRQFMLDGRVVVLDMENKIEGEIHLMVQWSPTFEAEGEIAIDIDVARIVKGTGRVGFYVYSTDQWAIYGESEIKLFNYLESSSEFFVGNSGFMLGMSSSVNYDLWIIEVGAGIDVKVWYMPGKSWGAYAKAWVKAEILWGVAKAKGWLQCALLGSEGNVYLYGQAGLEIHVLFTDWSGSAWAKISNGEVDGGRGSDSDMDALIAEAMGQSEAAEREMEDMKISIENRPDPGVSFSNDELRAAFATLTEWGSKYKYGNEIERHEAETFFNDLLAIEITDHYGYNPSRVSGESDLLRWNIDNVFKGQGAPDLTDFTEGNRSIQEAIDLYNEDKNALLPTFDEGFEIITQTSNEIDGNAVDPTAGTIFPQYRLDENGHYIISGQSSMNVDEDISNQNSVSLQNGINSINAYRERVFSEYQKLNTNIATIEKILKGRNGNSGTLKFSRSYASLVEYIHSTYLQQYMYYKQIKTWSTNRYAELLNRDSTPLSVGQIMRNKAVRIFDRNPNGYMALKLINNGRVEAISRLKGDDEATWRSAGGAENMVWENNSSLPLAEFRTWAINRSTEIGISLWKDIAGLGLQELKNTSRSMINNVEWAKREHIENAGAVQAEFTDKINTLYSTLGSLSETKYDIVKKLIDWEDNSFQPRLIDRTGKVIKSARKVQLENAMELLEQKMTVPTITQLEAVNYDLGICAYTNVRWNVSGPRNTYATFQVDFESEQPHINSQGYQSIGNKINLNLFYAPLVNQTTFGETTFHLKAVNEVGYSIHRSLTYRPTFSNTATERLGDITQTTYDVDRTPPTMSRIDFPYHFLTRALNDHPTGWDDFYNMHFVGDSSVVSAEWTGNDDESGVQEYRYKLVKTQRPGSAGFQFIENADDLELNPGVNPFGNTGDDTPPNPYSNWTNNFGRTNVVINGLDMQNGEYYQLKVAAKNGDGYWMEKPQGLSDYLFVDLVPPPAPVARPLPAHPAVNVPATSTIRHEIDLPPMSMRQFGNNLVKMNDNSEAYLIINYSIPTDEYTGSPFAKELMVSKVGHPEIASDWVTNFGNRIDNAYFPELNNMLNYIDSFYVDIRTYDLARNRSNLLRFKMQPFDNTAPSRPLVNFAYSSNYQRAYIVFESQSDDEQSGIQYYEVGLGSTRANISFDDGIKFYPNDIANNQTVLMPELPFRDRTIFAVRAVNGQGTRGAICYTGYFLQDETPPVTPTVTLGINNIAARGNFLSISFGNLVDNQTGIKNVQYMLYKKVSGSDSWTSVIYWRATDNLNGTSINLGDYGIGNNIDLKVEVRSMNTVGLLSTVGSSEIRIPDTSRPFAPTVTINSGSPAKNDPPAVGLRFGNLVDPESGIQKVEYKIEKANDRYDITYSSVKGWTSNGTKTTKVLSYSTLRLNAGDYIKVTVRSYNNDGLISEDVTRTHTLN
ncbi:MAG: hypothetical protein KKF62_19180 [Bacteroidetes bacterium]|nr:hypothetical protein [Bacteroidota bacterium]MBU1117020.1 hypothetical protein [Bacteroidota bacterium]MBU1797615.1 hypothetical protein [Bacteroidota bacterium]